MLNAGRTNQNPARMIPTNSIIARKAFMVLVGTTVEVKAILLATFGLGEGQAVAV
jgi:hypothetical protein